MNNNNHKYVGPVFAYFENGQKEKECVLNEKRKKHGKYTLWDYDTTLLLECNYVNGVLDGEYKKYKEGNLTKHVKYSNGNITEYLNSDLIKKKINKIHNGAIEIFNKKITNIDLTNFFVKNDKNTKAKAKAKAKAKDASGHFISIIDILSESVLQLNTIKTSDDELTIYNNLKKMDIIKTIYDTFNTKYGMSYLNTYPEDKQNLSIEINEFIDQFDKKKELIYQNFKLYLVNVKHAIFSPTQKNFL